MNVREVLVQTQKQAFEMIHVKIIFIWKDVGVSLKIVVLCDICLFVNHQTNEAGESKIQISNIQINWNFPLTYLELKNLF